jgi:hypothetical protein
MVQSLRHRVHLVVMDAVREGENLVPKGFKPRRPQREKNLASFDDGALRRHARDLVADWQNGISANAPVAKVLDQDGAAALILDQKRRVKTRGEAPPVKTCITLRSSAGNKSRSRITSSR